MLFTRVNSFEYVLVRECVIRILKCAVHEFIDVLSAKIVEC